MTLLPNRYHNPQSNINVKTQLCACLECTHPCTPDAHGIGDFIIAYRSGTLVISALEFLQMLDVYALELTGYCGECAAVKVTGAGWDGLPIWKEVA